MKKKLLLLDLVLAALVAATGWQVRKSWDEAKKREAVVLRVPFKALAPPPYAPVPKVEPLTAAEYGDIAQKMLFAADRNPNIVIEVAPPKPMPPLPVVHGVLNFGDGPTVILSAAANAVHQGFRPGQTIGEFKLLGISGDEIVFEWDGKQIAKKLEELIDRSAPQPAAPQASAAAPRQASPPAPVPASAPAVKSGPGGVSLGGDLRSCQPDDPSPDGTVKDGYKKVVLNTPFGKMCRWEPLR